MKWLSPEELGFTPLLGKDGPLAEGVTGLRHGESFTPDMKSHLDSLISGGRLSDPAAMFYAAGFDHVALLRELLDKGLDIDVRHHGMTALMSAAGSCSVGAFGLLLSEGAGVNVRDEEGWTALFYSASNCPELTEALLAAGADVNARADDGQTALMQAAYSWNVANLKLLLSARADVNARDGDGKAALDYAVMSGYDQGFDEADAEVLRTLTEYGADASMLRGGEI
jgi:ankyrin repeat protein